MICTIRPSCHTGAHNLDAEYSPSRCNGTGTEWMNCHLPEKWRRQGHGWFWWVSQVSGSMVEQCGE
jgi:hypothetical protein